MTSGQVWTSGQWNSAWAAKVDATGGTCTNCTAAGSFVVTGALPAGSIVVGAPTGGNLGAGTVNATGLFLNGVAVGAASSLLTVQTPTAAVTRTLAGTDSGTVIPFTAASPVIVTLPATLAVGSNTDLCQQGAGTVKVVQGAGATLVSALNAVPAAGQCMQVRVVSNAGGTAANWNISGSAITITSPGGVIAPSLPPTPPTPLVTYYVSPTGSDAANGLTTGTAWQTIAKVNALSAGTALADKTAVAFQGGQSWTGCLAFIKGGNVASTTPGGGIQLIAYGTGTYTITSNCAGTGTGTQGPKSAVVKFDGVNGVYVNRGAFLGANTGTQYGILVQNSLDTTGITNVTITNSTATGANIAAGATGDVSADIGIKGYTTTGTCSAINQVLISGNTVGGTVVTGADDNGIFAHGCSVVDALNITNVTILNNTVTNIGGRSAAYAGGSGNGILTNGAQYTNVSYNTVTFGGANITSCGGAGGIWTYNTDSANIHHNEVNHMQPTAAVATGCDWNAYNLDGGTTNSVMQYNHSALNWGPGYEFFIAVGGRTKWGPNTIRYNTSENDNAGNRTSISFAPGYGIGAMLVSGGTLNPSLGYIYNNVFYNNVSDSQASCIGFAPNIMSSGVIANNICVIPGQTSSVFLGGGGNSPGGVYFVANDYQNLNGAASPTFSAASFPTNINGVTTWGATALGGEAGSSQANPGFSGTPSPAVCTVTASVGPQGCPTAYSLGAGSAMKGVGVNLLGSPYNLTVGATDYYNAAIPNANAGTGYNIGAFGN